MADEDHQDDPDGNDQDNLKALRQAADDGRKARQEAEQLKREIAFRDAGVDVKSGWGKLLLKSYDGKLEIEEIQAAVADLGIETAKKPAVEFQPGETDQTNQRGQLSSDAGVPGDGSQHPWDAARNAFADAKRDGARDEQAFGAAMAHIFGAANAGDDRVLYREPIRRPEPIPE